MASDPTPPQAVPAQPADTEKAQAASDGHHAETSDGSVVAEETKPAPPPGPPLPPHLAANPPPNGGTLAWLHVVGGFMLLFNSWGLLNAFGVFQTYYESGALFNRSSSDISWIGSIQWFLVMFMGLFVGPIYDRGHLKPLLCTGAFLIVFGNMMLSLCKEYWQVVLAQGFCIGMGAGCLFTPCISLLPTYFSTKMGLALGLAYSGSSVGGIIYPIILYNLIDQIGFAWSVRVMGFIALGTLMIPIAVMRIRVKMPRPRALIDWTAFTDWPYMTFILGGLIGMIGLTLFLFYLSFYAVEQGITDTRLGFYLVPILNVGSVFGRVVPNAISDKTGPFNMMAPCATITGILILCMMAVHGKGAVIVLALLGGFFSGVFIALPAPCMIPLIKDKSRIGTRLGMGFAMMSWGLLAGGPGAGAVLGTHSPLHWDHLWTYGGVTCLVAGAFFTAIRVHRSGAKLIAKA